MHKPLTSVALLLLLLGLPLPCTPGLWPQYSSHSVLNCLLASLPVRLQAPEGRNGLGGGAQVKTRAAVSSSLVSGALYTLKNY